MEPLFYMPKPYKEFERFLRVDKGFAQKTIEGYMSTIQRFQGETPQDAHDYIAEMYEEEQLY